LPESNYGQYIMLWDHAFGSYRPYQEHYGSGAGSSTAGTAKAKAA
jgi:sterol desaturase/sphingolipid hydroxylase (fatty acid hydroxylase superfamily)